MRTEYTINGESYDLLIMDGSIHLQNLHADLIFDKGFEACRESARDYLKGLRDDYGFAISYSESRVDEVAHEYIADYVKTESYTILTHNNN